MDYKLAENHEHQTVVRAVYADGSQKEVTSLAKYGSSNPSVVVVSDTGLVRGLSPGNAEIVINYAYLVKRVKISVVQEGETRSLTGIRLDSNAYRLKVGDSHHTVGYASVTRAEFIVMLVRALHLQNNKTSLAFSDSE
ncbi:Ig-like domain-containing protein [Paenibacillus marchantiophytorum]|uniref:Ig-like domain-containing protein n=1 Tax=Paenibacillus marchantiophytorum TaxID=1619310 RepID=UPI00166740A9|nr:Ig-like domain-containing protein [Paenibacillus marchantiophytorum]